MKVYQCILVYRCRATFKKQNIMYVVWGEQTALEVCVAYSAWQEGILFRNLFVRIQKGLLEGESSV
jgi:hypothetical protein